MNRFNGGEITTGKEENNERANVNGPSSKNFQRLVQEVFGPLESKQMREIGQFKSQLDEIIQSNMDAQFTSFMEKMKEAFHTISMKISYLEKNSEEISVDPKKIDS